MKNDPVEKIFTRRLIRPETWVINLGSNINATASYLLLGKAKALVIDTGEHTYNLRKYISSITNLPLIVANTHSHFDHTGNDYQFKDCPIYMSIEATKEIKKNIHNYLNPDDYEYDYTAIGVPDGYEIDLGERKIKGYLLGSHSVTSMMWIDKTFHILFSGDEIECGQVLLMGPASETSIVHYRQNLIKIRQLRDAGDFDIICPAHNGSPIDASFIDTLIENCDNILAGTLGKENISSPSFMQEGSPQVKEREERLKQLMKNDYEAYKKIKEPVLRRSEWNGSSIVYDISHIY